MNNISRTVLENDKRILNLATYYESKGNMISVKHPKVIWDRFTEFKMRLKRNSITFEQLEDMVYSKYGIVQNFTPINDFSNVEKELYNLLISKKEKKI